MTILFLYDTIGSEKYLYNITEGAKNTMESKKVFGFPIKIFTTAKDLHKQMMSAEENTLFLIGEEVTKFPEGDDKITLIWAKIFKTRD